jgi:TolB-like protein/DNA-binding SARP family transcriptional activator
VSLEEPKVIAIKLLGDPAVSRAGVVLNGRPVQGRRLALLSLIASAGSRPISRDKIIARLWPETTTERARHQLSDTLYILRSKLGDDAIRSSGDDLSLNEELVSSDLAEFARFHDEGQLERAAEVYTGPLLDGFHLDDAAEFERWLDGERARLGHQYAAVLEALARRAEEAGDIGAAVGWWRRLAAHDPYSARITLGLMHCLDAAGDRAGALRHARIHEQLLEMEFQAKPDAEVVALASRMRSAPAARGSDEANGGAAPFPTTLDEQVGAGDPATTDHSGSDQSGTVAPEISAGTGAPGSEPGTVQAAPAAPPRPLRGRRVGYGIAAAALLTIVAVGLQLRSSSRTAGALAPSATTGQTSIAVLPLANLSTDAADAVIADGMTEELIATLARVPELRVIASTSAFAVRDRRLDLRSAAESLGVSHVLEGSLQKVGSRVRIRLRLADGRDGSAIWAENYDRELSDVLALQEEVARSVTDALGVRLRVAGSAGGRRLPTENVAAYELYLRGTDRTLLRSESAATGGLALLYRAAALDSGYAAAWAGIARLHGRLSLQNSPGSSDHAAQAESAARRAAALDESLPEAQATLGLVLFLRLDLAGAERHLRRALSLDPNRALWHEWIVHLYLMTGESERALAHARRALDLDPLSPYAHAEVARVLTVIDGCDEALPILQRLSALDPPLLRLAPLTAQCHATQARWEAAIAAIQRQADAGRPRARALLAYLLARSGRRDEALRTRDGLVDQWKSGRGEAYAIAIVEAGLGNTVEAIRWLELAVADGSFVAGTLESPVVFGPLFADVRRHPRFADIASRLRFAEASRQKR